MLFLMGGWLNSGGGGRFTVLHGGARIFFLWVFNPRKVSDVFLVFFLCLVFSERILLCDFANGYQTHDASVCKRNNYISSALDFLCRYSVCTLTHFVRLIHWHGPHSDFKLNK
jgi:hypothetical protein